MSRTRRQGGLGALLRVRSVRERDSRTGLATTLAEEREAAARVADLERALTELPAPATYDVHAFQGRLHTLERIRVALADARASLEGAQQLSAAARDRWIADRSRLDAVESLVERRAAAVRAERARRERVELDEVAEEMWRRSHAAGGAS